jgi:tripartite-type tricarboxylate transporter receptor subunit TctC
MMSNHCRVQVKTMGHARTLIPVFLSLVIAAAAPATAQDWPSGTVRVIVPYSAGGPVDLPTRLLIDRLAAQTKGTFILEHRAGAGGAVGAQAVMQSAPDGNTLLSTTSSLTTVAALNPKLNLDPLNSLVSISLITELPISVSVRANHPFRDLADLIAQAKAAPGKYTFGSGGVGTGNHMAGELLKSMAGINLLHVPFRGSSMSMTALYSGDIDMVCMSAIEALGQARDGRMRVLGIGSTQRMPELPDTPVIAELVPGYTATNWYGLFAPRGLPAAVLARLETEIAKARTDPALVERSKAVGLTMLLSPSDVLRARMESEVPRWKQLVQELGLKAE